jgi:glycosyltransferase involved in cell wall biosynthesis
MRFGCLRYWTQNIGDEIQTLAALNYLPPDVVYVDRDDSARSTTEDECFVICNGWWMHGRNHKFQFPLAPNIRPLFVSVHLADPFRQQLTPEMFGYLRQHSPIGCRDVRSLNVLQQAGIPAYYSGCLTATFGLFEQDPTDRGCEKIGRGTFATAGFPGFSPFPLGASPIFSQPHRGPGVCLVDVPAWAAALIPRAILERALWLTHHQVRAPAPGYDTDASRQQRQAHARRLLEHYRRAALVVTGRLHCALPALALGTPVVFVPRDGRDPRYQAIEGLVPVYRPGDTIDWSPNPVSMRGAAVPLHHLVREAVGTQSNPVKHPEQFPSEFHTPRSFPRQEQCASLAERIPAATAAGGHGTAGPGAAPPSGCEETGAGISQPVRFPVVSPCLPGASPVSSPPLTVMFLNLDIKPVRTGIENAALLRAKAFEAKLGLVPEIVTINYDPHFAETRAGLLRDGKVSPATGFRNLYDDFQGFAAPSGSSTHASIPVNAKWKYRDVAGTPDVRIYDEDGQLLMYKKCSRRSGVLEYVNFFHQGKMWRRDTYTTAGILSRIQYLERDTREAAFECYLRPDGSVAIIQLYTRDNGRRELSKISLLSQEGCCTHEFPGKQSFIAHWLDCLTNDPDRWYLMVSDKNRFFYSPVRQVSSLPGKGNVLLVPIIHAVHTKDGFDVRRSGTNVNYAEILNEIRVPDAIVVGTAKQRADILERYGSGNVHAIPHACNEAGGPVDVAFAARERTQAIYLARYSEEKNHAAAIRAFGRVIAEVPEATLHTYGSGSGKGAVVELVKRLGLERAVFVHDYALDVSSIYRSAGVSLLTSKGEGYSLVVVESLCQGCPVIAFDVNYGPADMIRDGETGFLVPYGNEELLAAKLVEIFRHPELHERMCSNSLQSSSAFGMDEVAGRWRRLIRDLLTGRNPSEQGESI